MQYYKSLLSSRTDNYAVYAESVFEKRQRLLFAAGDVSSLYTRRNLTEFQRIAAYIRVTAEAKKGNYIVFFPSYRFMEDVYEQFLAMKPEEMECIIQGSNMRETEREAFMEEFSEARERDAGGLLRAGRYFFRGN